MRNVAINRKRQFREQAMDLVRVQGLEPNHAARELGMPHSNAAGVAEKARLGSSPSSRMHRLCRCGA